MIMSDDDIEAMLRDLVEEHLAEDARKAALNWLEKGSITYQAMQNLGLLDEDGTTDAATGCVCATPGCAGSVQELLAGLIPSTTSKRM